MEYKELVKHHTQLIKDQNDNKWEVIEASDLEEICEAYHQDKSKSLGIANVSQQRELLIAFLEWYLNDRIDVDITMIEGDVDDYLVINCG